MTTEQAAREAAARWYENFGYKLPGTTHYDGVLDGAAFGAEWQRAQSTTGWYEAGLNDGRVQVEELEERIKALEAAARAVLACWDEALPAIRGAATLAYIHGKRYEGPSMAEPIAALRALLAAPASTAEPTP